MKGRGVKPPTRCPLTPLEEGGELEHLAAVWIAKPAHRQQRQRKIYACESSVQSDGMIAAPVSPPMKTSCQRRTLQSCDKFSPPRLTVPLDGLAQAVSEISGRAETEFALGA